MSSSALTPDAIAAAAPSIPAELRDTPQFVSRALSEEAGREVVLKIETVNPIGCFKGRGCWVALSRLVELGEVGPDRGVVLVSAGNFALGVAHAGRALGVPVCSFMTEDANPSKVAKLRRLGCEIVQRGTDLDSCFDYAREFAADRGRYLFVDGKEIGVSLGAGSIALELCAAVERGELPPPSTFYVPVGDGGLISGVGTWVHDALPGARVVGVQSEAAPAVALSWRAGEIVTTETADTCADGMETRIPIPEALELMRGNVDEILLVDEGAIREAQRDLGRELGIAVEAAAGASLAGLRADSSRDGAAALIVTGANIPTVDWMRFGDEATQAG